MGRPALFSWLLLALLLAPVAGPLAAPAQATGPALGPVRTAAPAPAGPNPYAHARVTTRLLAGAGHTHGYEVLVDGRVLVTQPSVPGRPGNAGFRTPAEALRVAALVARKVRANELPPAVTEAELRRLHAGQ